MELDGVLCGNSLLKEFFNEYLRLAVFPVQLTYNDSNGMITETSGNVFPWLHEPGVRTKLLDWAEKYRWPYFLKSRLYHEYCLCVLLFPQPKSCTWVPSSRQLSSLLRSVTTSNGFIVRHRSSHLELVGVASETGSVTSGRMSVMSLGLPDEIWEEEPVAIVTDNTCTHESYLEFQKLKLNLRGTTGESLMEVWLAVEGWKSSCNDNWLVLKTLRRKMKCVHLMDEIGSEERKMECAQSECLERLKTYWLSRHSQSFNSDSKLQSTNDSCNGDKWVELEDTDLPFTEGLRYNRHSGNPFQAHLERSCLVESLNRMNFWDNCDQLLTQHVHYKEMEFVRETWRIWSTFLVEGSVHAIGQVDTSKDELFTALTDDCAMLVKEKLEQLQLEILSQLKRLWTQYLHDDHNRYQQCFGKRNSSCHGDKESASVSSKGGRSNKRRKKRKQTVSIDLESGPLELLGDMETLLSFEQYLYTECGPLSVENICYQLWKNIMKYHKATQQQKKDALAVQIHRTFVYHQSSRCIALPESLKEKLDPQEEIQRPATPTLFVLQELAADVVDITVKKFMYSEDDSLGSLPSIGKHKPSRSLSRSSKVSRTSTVIFQEDSLHLSHTLLNCEGRTPHKLRAFASYLEEEAPPSVKGVLVNNVQFWLEVKKFKDMYDNETNVKVLFHKGEAIVDRYLDTTSPPWVKVSLNSEAAMHIVSAVSDLSKVKVRSHIDKLCDLLLKAQELTFMDMLPYWGAFCKQYKSPDGSVVSLPPVTSCMASAASRYAPPTLRLPALSRIRDQTPLLSFSQYKGLQWRSPLQH